MRYRFRCCVVGDLYDAFRHERKMRDKLTLDCYIIRVRIKKNLPLRMN
jgi:hypothetical protein